MHQKLDRLNLPCMVIHSRFYILGQVQCHIGALASGGPALDLHGVPWVGHLRQDHHLEAEQER